VDYGNEICGVKSETSDNESDNEKIKSGKSNFKLFITSFIFKPICVVMSHCIKDRNDYQSHFEGKQADDERLLLREEEEKDDYDEEEESKDDEVESDEEDEEKENKNDEVESVEEDKPEKIEEKIKEMKIPQRDVTNFFSLKQGWNSSDYENIGIGKNLMNNSKIDVPPLPYPFGILTHSPLNIPSSSFASVDMYIPISALSGLDWEREDIFAAINKLKKKQDLKEKQNQKDSEEFNCVLQCKVTITPSLLHANNSVSVDTLYNINTEKKDEMFTSVTVSRDELNALLFFHSVLFDRLSVIKSLFFNNNKSNSKEMSVGEKMINSIYSTFLSRFQPSVEFSDVYNKSFKKRNSTFVDDRVNHAIL
jgi:hypothetical protein